jgi:hypothetical protein
VDVVVLQRPEEQALATEWLGGRVPGVDVPAVYLEHNTPPDAVGAHPHALADQDAIPVVHVTHANALFWDTGRARTTVVEHGVVDPGLRYTGELARAAVVVNDPVRRGRAVGTDLLERFRSAGPVDLFGMRSEPLGGTDLPQHALHVEMARRRVYVHTARWTSLGLSLLEAMHLGIPVVALATTEVPRAVPRVCGVVSTDVDALVRAVRELLTDRDAAAELGRRGREHARRRYGLERFLDDWDRLLKEVVA